MKCYPLLMAAVFPTLLSQNLPADEAAVKAAATGNNAFATDLFQQLDKTNADKNFFLAPFSISSALTMTAQGAKAKTLDQMAKVLHLAANSPAGIADINTQLLGSDVKRPYELSVANDLWVDQTFPLAAGFVADAKKNFQAGVTPLDFIHQADASRRLINNAIASQTHDKIKDLLPADSVDATTALILTNAIYFKGTWETQFNKNATTDQPFHAPGTDVTVPLMRSPNSAAFAYSETDALQTVSLPYKSAVGRSSPDLSMVIILPKKLDGLADVEKQFSPDALAQWTANARRQPLQVFLPRFTMTTQFELSKELKALGMTYAFTGAADFSGISASAGGKLAISSVVHKAFVDVNEEGTEAAAATGVIMSRTAIMSNPAVFRADHPFLYLIRHEPTGTILFLGHVINPK
jgi:serpin B